MNSQITVNKCFLTFLSNSASNVLLFLLTTAGWKLSPMVGAMYSPELYTGITTRINFIPHEMDGDKTHECCCKPGGIKTLSFFSFLSVSTGVSVPSSSSSCLHRRDLSRRSSPGSCPACLQRSQGSCATTCHPDLPGVNTQTLMRTDNQ